MHRWRSIIAGLLVVALVTVGCASRTSVQADPGWITLLDGDTGLENWTRFGDGNWRAVDGAIQIDGKTGARNSVYLVTKSAYADFQIRIEFWVGDDGNSGIYMRCADPGNILDTNCYEAQISDRRPTYPTGSIVNLVEVSQPKPKAGGKWNTYEITAKGSHLTVVLNGMLTAEVNDSKFASGPIALQYSAGVVKYRKLQIRPL